MSSENFEPIAVDALYSESAVCTGFSMPSPPALKGRASISLSGTDISRPSIEGISVSLIARSSGLNSSLISDIVLWTYVHL